MICKLETQIQFWCWIQCPICEFIPADFLCLFFAWRLWGLHVQRGSALDYTSKIWKSCRMTYLSRLTIILKSSMISHASLNILRSSSFCIWRPTCSLKILHLQIVWNMNSKLKWCQNVQLESSGLIVILSNFFTKKPKEFLKWGGI